MTVLRDPALDERDGRGPADTARTGADRTGGPEAAAPARWALAAALAGAGIIHLAMAPSHLGESAVDGWGFLVAGWAQVALAVLVLARPAWRSLLAVAAAVNVLLIGGWAVSRTAGLPVGAHAGEPESVSFVDAATVALEAVAVLLALWLLLGAASALLRSSGLAAAGALAALVLTTAAIASPAARDHAAGGGHAHGGTESAAGIPGMDGGDDLGWSELQNGQMGAHEHEEAATSDSLDPRTSAELAGQLALTAPLVERYPTLGDARADGYRQAGPFLPGLGTHYSKIDDVDGIPGGAMDESTIGDPILIFDGVEEESPLAGFMYLTFQEEEPEGFVGPLDRWHYHTSVCVVVRADGVDLPFGADVAGITEEMCAAEGGALMDFSGWMVHVWTVPGYESPLGTFSDLNPRITCPDGTYHIIPMTEFADTLDACRSA